MAPERFSDVNARDVVGNAADPKRMEVLQTYGPGLAFVLPNKHLVSFQFTFERALFASKPTNALLHFRDCALFDGGAQVEPTPGQAYRAVVSQRPGPGQRKGMRVKLALRSGKCLTVLGKTLFGRDHSSAVFYVDEVVTNKGAMACEMADKKGNVVGIVHVECRLQYR